VTPSKGGGSSSDDSEPPVVLPIGDSIDLHAFAPRDIASVVESYLEAAREAGLREVRIIHGRGKGIQKERVRQVLARSEHVTHFEEATPDRGGFGATVARLKGPE
jgi:dsDNA-specific endonuclease/ATPase MutS2